MGYKLEAFILSRKAAEMLPTNFRHLHRFRLSEQLALIPVTRQLYQELVATFGKAEDDPYDGMFYALHPAMARMAVEISSVAPVLYMEVDMASGIGDRAAIVWHQGEAAYGPDWGSPCTTEALRLFGRLEGLSLEQFGELDIFRHRFTEDWVREIEGKGD